MSTELTPAGRGEHGRRVLIVVDDPCTAPGLCDVAGMDDDGLPLEALVVAPAHDPAAAQWYVDEDAARADAAYRLHGCVACLGRAGVHVQGRLGSSDPVRAVDDALHDFAADEILFVTTPLRPSRWLRPNVVDRARRAFRQPIRHVEMPPAPGPGP